MKMDCYLKQVGYSTLNYFEGYGFRNERHVEWFPPQAQRKKYFLANVA
jgi:hypothetical protein